MATMRRPQPAPSEVVAQPCVLTTSTARLNFARAPAKPLCRPHLPSPAKMYLNLPSRQSRLKTKQHLLARIQNVSPARDTSFLCSEFTREQQTRGTTAVWLNHSSTFGPPMLRSAVAPGLPGDELSR